MTHFFRKPLLLLLLSSFLFVGCVYNPWNKTQELPTTSSPTQEQPINSPTAISPENSLQEEQPENSNQETPEVAIEPLDTTNWKTYTNETYGYSVKYPEDWVVFTDIDFENGNRLIYKEEHEDSVRLAYKTSDPAPDRSFKDIGIGVTREKINEDLLHDSTFPGRVIAKRGDITIVIGASWPSDRELEIMATMERSFKFLD